MSSSLLISRGVARKGWGDDKRATCMNRWATNSTVTVEAKGDSDKQVAVFVASYFSMATWKLWEKRIRNRVTFNVETPQTWTPLSVM